MLLLRPRLDCSAPPAHHPATGGPEDRNNALWTEARSCENGSLTVSRMFSEGVPYTRTMNSSGFEFPIFEACYREKAAPIWGAYCKAEAGNARCRP